MPEQLYGCNISFQDKKLILLCDRKGLFYATREHTFLHETRELLENYFTGMGFPTIQGKSLEAIAEEFAIAVRVELSMKLFVQGMDQAKQIEVKWKRWASFAFFGIIGIGNALGCILLPYLEEQMARQKQRT